MKPHFKTEAKAMVWWFFGLPVIGILAAILVMQVLGQPRLAPQGTRQPTGVAP
ncbi:MAG: hypothetical protein U0610_29695 [bacterium]